MANINKQMDYGDIEFSKNVGIFKEMLTEVRLTTFFNEIKMVFQKSYEEYKDSLSDDEYMDKEHIKRCCKFFLYDNNETFGIALKDDEIEIEGAKEKELERLELVMQNKEFVEKLKSNNVTPIDVISALYKAGIKED